MPEGRLKGGTGLDHGSMVRGDFDVEHVVRELLERTLALMTAWRPMGRYCQDEHGGAMETTRTDWPRSACASRGFGDLMQAAATPG